MDRWSARQTLKYALQESFVLLGLTDDFKRHVQAIHRRNGHRNHLWFGRQSDSVRKRRKETLRKVAEPAVVSRRNMSVSHPGMATSGVATASSFSALAPASSLVGCAAVVAAGTVGAGIVEKKTHDKGNRRNEHQETNGWILYYFWHKAQMMVGQVMKAALI